MSNNIPKCSFCGKTPDQVKQLVQSSNVYICESCLQTCINVLVSRGTFSQEGLVLTAPAFAERLVDEEIRQKVLFLINKEGSVGSLFSSLTAYFFGLSAALLQRQSKLEKELRDVESQLRRIESLQNKKLQIERELNAIKSQKTPDNSNPQQFHDTAVCAVAAP